MKPSEKQTQKAILDYLAYRPGFFWRNNIGAVIAESKGKKRFFRYGLKGSADIIGVIPPKGQLVCIEVKAPRSYQSLEQKEFQKEIERHGGIYILARSITDLIERGL